MTEKDDRLSFQKFGRPDNLSLSKELADYDQTTNSNANIVSNCENKQDSINISQIWQTGAINNSLYMRKNDIQNSNFEQNPTFKQNSTFDQNSNFKQNPIFDQNSNFKQNSTFDQNPTFDQNGFEEMNVQKNNPTESNFSSNNFQSSDFESPSSYSSVNNLHSEYNASNQRNGQVLLNENGQMYDYSSNNQNANSFDQAYSTNSNATEMKSYDQYGQFFMNNPSSSNDCSSQSQQTANSSSGSQNMPTNYKESNWIDDMSENHSNFQNTLAQQYLNMNSHLNSHMQGNESDGQPDNFKNHAFLLDNFLYKKSKPFRTIISTLKKKKTKNKCFNCQTDETSLWRKINLYEMQNGNSKQKEKSHAQVPANTSQQPPITDATDTNLVKKDIKIVCNACGLYFKMHKRMRPVSMSKGIRKRNRKKDGNNLSRHHLFQLKPENTAGYFQNHNYEQSQMATAYNHDFTANNQSIEFSADYNLDPFSNGYQGHQNFVNRDHIEMTPNENVYSNTFTKYDNSIYGQPDYHQQYNQSNQSQNLSCPDNQSNGPFNYVFQPFGGKNENFANITQINQQMAHKNNQMAHFEMDNQEMYQNTFAQKQQPNDSENFVSEQKKSNQNIIETQNLNDRQMPENFTVEAFENECEINERVKEMHR